jgi:hypothetical protein
MASEKTKAGTLNGTRKQISHYIIYIKLVVAATGSSTLISNSKIWWS